MLRTVSHPRALHKQLTYFLPFLPVPRTPESDTRRPYHLTSSTTLTVVRCRNTGWRLELTSTRCVEGTYDRLRVEFTDGSESRNVGVPTEPSGPGTKTLGIRVESPHLSITGWSPLRIGNPLIVNLLFTGSEDRRPTC